MPHRRAESCRTPPYVSGAIYQAPARTPAPGPSGKNTVFLFAPHRSASGNLKRRDTHVS